MTESVLELQVGDIVFRQRLLSQLLFESSSGHSSTYGPLTLEVQEEQILVSDIDDRVYTPIDVDTTLSEKEQVSDVLVQADNKVIQFYDDL